MKTKMVAILLGIFLGTSAFTIYKETANQSENVVQECVGEDGILVCVEK